MSAGGDQGDGDTFAKLIDDETRPIARGPERVTPSSPRPPGRSRRPGSSDHTRPTDDQPFRQPDLEEPLCGAASGVSNAQISALKRGEPEPAEKIDLHGLRSAQVPRLLASRLASARERGLQTVSVIHGRGARSPDGEAVLRNALPGWLARPEIAPHVLAFAPAPRHLGGEGATLILLRR
jgi:DNA-nicking Smr family endonuclease